MKYYIPLTILLDELSITEDLFYGSIFKSLTRNIDFKNIHFYIEKIFGNPRPDLTDIIIPVTGNSFLNKNESENLLESYKFLTIDKNEILTASKQAGWLFTLDEEFPCFIEAESDCFYEPTNKASLSNIYIKKEDKNKLTELINRTTHPSLNLKTLHIFYDESLIKLSSSQAYIIYSLLSLKQNSQLDEFTSKEIITKAWELYRQTEGNELNRFGLSRIDNNSGFEIENISYSNIQRLSDIFKSKKELIGKTEAHLIKIKGERKNTAYKIKLPPNFRVIL
ncbi:hypothetical protein [Bacteriovorax sp. BAL6_X]|uniref:hypothetical protein n=1 Tax=Bacteriovorax sp. BAL6_X TaxID=1201290 RepID=UPI0004004030|nr:hypothetical protein [Bacteriovorax sp. BAL6_X]